LHDTGIRQRPTAQTSQDDRLTGAQVIENAEDFDLKLLDAGTGKDGPAHAVLAGVNVFERENLGRGLQKAREPQPSDAQDGTSWSQKMSSHSYILGPFEARCRRGLERKYEHSVTLE